MYFSKYQRYPRYPHIFIRAYTIYTVFEPRSYSDRQVMNNKFQAHAQKNSESFISHKVILEIIFIYWNECNADFSRSVERRNLKAAKLYFYIETDWNICVKDVYIQEANIAIFSHFITFWILYCIQKIVKK